MTVDQTSSTPFDLAQEELASMEQILDSFDEKENHTKGDLLEAVVMDVYDKDVYLDIGSKQNGRCPISDFEIPPVKNDRVEVVVLRKHEDGMIDVSKKEADRRVSWQHVKSAFEEKAQVTGLVEREVKHGFIVKSGGVELFMPLSQSGVKKGEKFKPGQTIDFKILELKDRYHSAIVSHLAVISERNDQSWKDLTEKHSVGDIVEGRVSKKVSFGVFVNVEGIEGLLHQSDISWKKFAPFKDRFKVNDVINVKILTMDKENNRLSLGLKQLSEDPWEWVKKDLEIGSTVRGQVTSITDYGVFLEIREGLEGLIHVSELTWAKRVRHPKKYLQPGQEVEAKVLSIDFEHHRIGLGVKQLQADPWDSIKGNISTGEILEGIVTSVTKFGAFVQIRDEVEGLIHFKDYSWDDKADQKMLKKGDTVRYKILDINIPERRISCGIKQLTPSPYEMIKQKYRKGEVIDCKVTGITDFGIFVDIGDGFEGLIHISRIPHKDGQKLDELYKKGDTLQAALLKIDTDEKKIALSIKDVEKRKEREIISSYMKQDDAPSTSSLGAFFKKDTER